MIEDDLSSKDDTDKSIISSGQSWEISNRQLKEVIEQRDSSRVTNVEDYFRSYKYIK